MVTWLRVAIAVVSLLMIAMLLIRWRYPQAAIARSWPGLPDLRDAPGGYVLAHCAIYGLLAAYCLAAAFVGNVALEMVLLVAFVDALIIPARLRR